MRSQHIIAISPLTALSLAVFVGIALFGTGIEEGVVKPDGEISAVHEKPGNSALRTNERIEPVPSRQALSG